ncbi:MAG: hypothetical protein FWE91_08395 [Defluviitaleaceae bacterium]|nr:hypothetical protein [Defluviitaleaceae bacterium]MCL2835293.1 hypothetical protein [Defluviitaleaceae bacterium]
MNNTGTITPAELNQIHEKTLLRITTNPKDWGIAADGGYDMLFFEEANDFIINRAINQMKREGVHA